MSAKHQDPKSEASRIAVTAGICLGSFRRCLQDIPSSDPRETSMMEDECAKFSTWAESMRVFGSAPASIDYCLRHAPEVQDVVAGLLVALDCRIHDCELLLFHDISASAFYLFC